MQYKRGFSKLIIISIFSLILLIIILFFLFKKSPETSFEMKSEDVLKIISLDERSAGISVENIKFTRTTNGFIRGTLFDIDNGIEKDFYLIKIGENWRVVAITDRPVSCERFSRLGFPNLLIRDCELSFSDAVTLSEIDSTLEDFFKNSSNFSLKIIATVEGVELTEEGQIVTLDSGGEIIKVILSGDGSKLEVGDLVVTKITPPNNNSNQSSNPSHTVYTTSDPVIVNQDDKNLFSQAGVVPSSEVLNIPNVVENESNKIYKINAPKTYAPPSYFFNTYDVDNSFIDIQLDGSF